jgi:chromosome segregation ATPase
MNRELTDEEKKLTEKGIEKRKKEIEKSETSIKIINAQKEYVEAKRKYEDFMRPYNREEQDTEISQALDSKEKEIQSAKEDLERLNSNLIKGVEIKNPSSVQ